MAVRLSLLALGLALTALLFMTLGVRGGWDFVLPFRGAKLAAMLLVGGAVAVSTLLFQTITQNRILTPSIMGYHELYILLFTGFVFVLGAERFTRVDPAVTFAVAMVTLTGASLALFGTLLRRSGADLMRMILTGVILATLFRSLRDLVSRMIDPNEYSVLQRMFFTDFSNMETDLLWVSLGLGTLAMAQAWRMRHRLDVLALGRTAAISLGENPDRGRFEALLLIAVLVSVSTALAGPVVFLGLLAVNVTYLLLPGARHAVLLPGVALVSGIVLVGGQTVLERLLGLATPLPVVIDLLGGATFLWLVMKGIRR